MNWYQKIAQNNLDPYYLLQQAFNALSETGYKVQPDQIEIVFDNIPGEYGHVKSDEIYDPKDNLSKGKKSKIHLNFEAIKERAIAEYGNDNPEALKQAIIDQMAEVLSHEGAAAEGEKQLGHIGDFINALQHARKQPSRGGILDPFPGGEGVAESVQGKIRNLLRSRRPSLYSGKKHRQ